MTKYDHRVIEEKWQKKWTDEKLYKTPVPTQGKKKYVLDMFPYPSGSTMHVGHLEGYVGTDILCRYLRMKGDLVLHPMGWDAFGLPAENYAIKTGIHPSKSTQENISTFKRQLIASGLSYDWTREIDTSSPEYYKWTQWLFIQLFKKGLAYKKKALANWCPNDKTVLANEQVVDGKCERCETEVIQKELDQWFFKITEYADKLIEGLDKLDWLDEVKTQQINWIGRKTGTKIKFGEIEIFTTRPETINSATFVVLSPNHPLAGKIKMVVNPANNKKIPVFVDEYVLDEVGTGAVMGVPGYDERDLKFAQKHNLEILKLEPKELNLGSGAVTYHLRDWLVSRQRYWGTPIPMIYCKRCAKDVGARSSRPNNGGQENPAPTRCPGWYPVPEDQLPVKLPDDVDFEKVAHCPVCGEVARRETDTMDGFVDSSWYFIRFADSNNNKEFVSKEAAKAWLPVDTYVGGGHVVQHLLFARFFWKVLIDAGLLDKSLGDEPFLKLRAPGWILGPDSRKMSKRWGNVVTPDEIIDKFGADTLRVYEMFIGPFETMKPWNMAGVEGVSRFLGRIYRLFEETYKLPAGQKDKTEGIISKLIKKVGGDIDSMGFNTAIAAMMETYNQIIDLDKGSLDWGWVWERWIVLLAPFAPHLAEEIWYKLGHTESVHKQAWPEYDPGLVLDKNKIIVVQVNGKVRDRIEAGPDIEQRALESAKVKNYLSGAKYRTIIIPGKLINFVI